MSVPPDMEGAIAVLWNQFFQMRVELTVPFERDIQQDSCAADSCQMLDSFLSAETRVRILIYSAHNSIL